MNLKPPAEFHGYCIMRICLVFFLFIFSTAASALDPNKSGEPVSIDDVANQIRGINSWQILDARSQQNNGGALFRFKLLSKKGVVKVIYIDPKKPNLGALK